MGNLESDSSDDVLCLLKSLDPMVDGVTKKRGKKMVSDEFEVKGGKGTTRVDNVHLDTLLPPLNDVLALLHQILENVGLVELRTKENDKRKEESVSF